MQDKTKLYDYVFDRISSEKILGHYKLEYKNKDGVAWMPCPFHNEKDPSFTIALNRKTYFCWGCKIKGNMFNFIKEYELITNGKELSYSDAVKKSAKICDVKIALTKSEELELELDAIDDVSDLLNESSITETHVQEIFQETAIKKYYVKKNNFMETKGFSKEILKYLEMGFLAGDYKDAMNNRCVFPVRNQYGGLVGWTGRTILTNVDPKWNHAPAKRFLKSLNLYNIDKALQYVFECGRINVVESIGNTIRMLESNRYNTVATLGSTISKEQCDMLLSYNVDIVFWYDWDNGGFEGLELVLNYIEDYDRLFIAITDYGINENGKQKDIADVDIQAIDKTSIITSYEYIILMKVRYISLMQDEFEKDKKIKLSDGTVVLCTQKINPKLEIPQLNQQDVTFFKTVDNLFGANELSIFE